MQQRAETLDTRISTLTDVLEKQRSAAEIDARLSGVQARRETAQTRTTEQTFGDMFVRHAAFAEYPGRGTSARVELDMLQTRAPLTTANFGTAPNDVLAFPVRRAVERQPDPIGVLDVANVIPVSTNSVEIVKYAFTSNADVVAEGAAKPESGPLVPTVTPVSLPTIAHYIQMTRQFIEDAPSIRARIDNEMRRGVEQKMQADAYTALTSANLGTAVSGGGDIMVAIRKAIGALQGRGYQPNGIMLNPEDHAEIDLTLTQVTGVPGIGQSFWGIPVVSSSRVAVGNAYVGDWFTGIEHYRRTAVSLYISDSHADTFVSNIFTLLAEARGVTVVVRPDALQHVTKA